MFSWLSTFAKMFFYNLALLKVAIKVTLLRKNLVVLDIDNTLAQTREYFMKHNKCDWIKISPDRQMVEYVEKMRKEEEISTEFIALTVRPLSTYILTKKWLYNVLSFKVPVFLAANQSMKVKMVMRLATLSHSTLFIDDFTYGDKEIKHYTKERQEIEEFERKNNRFKYRDPKSILN